MASILSAVSGLIVRNADGSMDLSATAENVKSLLAKELEATALRDSEIEATLDSVFTRLKVDVCATPNAIAMAASVLAGNDLSQMGNISEEIKDYLTRSSRFVGQRGRNGGLKRLPK